MKQTGQPLGIDYFGRGHWLTDLQVRISLRARRAMFDRWLAFAGSIRGLKVLDMGATPDSERQDSNCMLPWITESGADLTIFSLENIENLRPQFPKAKIVYPTRADESIDRLFAKQKFDWLVSSAVIEHVGSRERQIGFIKQCADLSDQFFLTTPDRRHWLEFHTKIPFIHWLPKPIHRRILRWLGKTAWADEQHLNVVSRGELQALARQALGDAFELHLDSIWALGSPSNILLFARRKKTN